MEESMQKMADLCDKYVPIKGKCDNQYGELIRACNRIGYRNLNDGDCIGLGYGNETLNAPARYIVSVCRSYGSDGNLIIDWIRDHWGIEYGDDAIEYFCKLMIEFLDKFKNELIIHHTDDMLGLPYFDPSDENWYEDEVEDEDY